MPISCPSSVGDPAPRVRRKNEWEDWERQEAEAVDKRLEQLEKAREKAAASLPRRQEERRRNRLDGLKRDLRLSRLQDTLLRAVDGTTICAHVAVETVYRVRWHRLSQKRRVKLLGRLRTLQHSLNLKLRDNTHRQRVAMQGGKLRIVSLRVWKKPRASLRIKRRSTALRLEDTIRQLAVTQCVEWLRALLARNSDDPWVPVAMVNDAARRKGFQPSTVKTARKRLRILRKHVGFGDKGGWLIRLRPQKPTKS